MPDVIPVAVIQASPVYYDLAASLDKAISLIREAAGGGAKLIALGETWLPGYPAWIDHAPGAALWGHEPTRQVFARLAANSVSVPGPEIDALRAVCRDLGVVLALGVNERVPAGPGSGTLYNALLTIDADGRLANHHRKLMPTYTERLVWGHGDAAGLQAVETSVGRVGGLVCWEHWMPLARQALHDSGEDLHVAVWPTVNEPHVLASRHYAFEGRCYVLAAGSILRARDLPPELPLTPDLAADPDALVQRGGSAIFGPDGRAVVGPVYDQETIVYADLDLNANVRERMTLDVSGHYARRELLELRVNRRRE